MSKLMMEVGRLEGELRQARDALRKAREDAHSFKVGQEVEAHCYVTAKRRYDYQRARIASIDFHGASSVTYKVVFLKKDGNWSIKPRYTSRVREVPAPE